MINTYNYIHIQKDFVKMIAILMQILLNNTNNYIDSKVIKIKCKFCKKEFDEQCLQLQQFHKDK